MFHDGEGTANPAGEIVISMFRGAKEMEKRPLKAQDLHRFVLPGEPQISPNSQEVAFVRQETSLEQNKNYTTLWMAAPGRIPRPLTHGQLNDRLPRWSPDGSRLAFVSGRTEQGKLWIIDRQGGEAWQLETDAVATSAPIWSPDGQQIAFVGKDFPHQPEWEPYAGAPDDDYQRAARQAAKTLGGKKSKDLQASDVKVITRIRHKLDGIGYFGDLRSQIFVVNVPLQPGAPVTCRQLTDGDYDHGLPTWSADGRYLYYTACRKVDADYLLQQDIWRIDPLNASINQILEWPGNISDLATSPDGKWLAFAGENKQFGGSTSPNLWLIPAGELALTARNVKNLTADLDRPIGNPPTSDVRFASNNHTIVWRGSDKLGFLYGNSGATCVGMVEVYSERLTILWQDPLRTVSAFDLGQNGELVLQLGGPLQAEELVWLAGGREQALTTFNQSIYDECLLGDCRRFSYSGDQGWPIDGWLLTPPSSEQSQPLPTVLLIHGGPHGVYGSSFMFQAQILASNGIAVVYANPRGSQSYGQAFASAVVGDWGGADYLDLMACVDHLVANGTADPAHLGIMGWSYGGFMTSWTITQTDRFVAALPGAIVGNRHSFYGSSDIGYFFGEHQFAGTPWGEPGKLLKRSAINFADRVRTPVLFMHGESDLRCPIEQTEQFFTALRRQGKTAVMVRYPNEFHAVSQPQHKLDRYARILAWFKHYLKQ